MNFLSRNQSLDQALDKAGRALQVIMTFMGLQYHPREKLITFPPSFLGPLAQHGINHQAG